MFDEPEGLNSTVCRSNNLGNTINPNKGTIMCEMMLLLLHASTMIIERKRFVCSFPFTTNREIFRDERRRKRNIGPINRRKGREKERGRRENILSSLLKYNQLNISANIYKLFEIHQRKFFRLEQFCCNVLELNQMIG